MPKMSKKWAIVLFSSLALNLFVGGMFVSHWIFHGRDETRTHAFGPQGMGRHMDRDTTHRVAPYVVGTCRRNAAALGNHASDDTRFRRGVWCRALR